MRKPLIIALLLILPFMGCKPFSDKGGSPLPPPRQEALTIDETTNIHYTGKYCDACHEKTPVKGGDAYLKYNGDYQFLCRCHHGMSPGYCHPLDVRSNEGGRWKRPSDFPLQNGKMSCNTCHNVYRQCQKRTFNKHSLRGRPYAQKTDFCFKCHDKESYKKLNAHLQIKEDGTISATMCLYCHKEKPDEKSATYKQVTFIGDIRALCRRCHQVQGNHAGNFDHMEKKPTAKGLERMEALKKKFNIILPLAKDGKMTCATCHNPHQKGVIPLDRPSAKGADSKYRHRLPGIMCKECHQM